MNDLIKQVLTLDFLIEFSGFVLNLMYLYFVIRQKAVAWIWSILACSLFVYVCFASQLYLQTGLYLFYIAIAFYGLREWRKKETRSVKSMTKKHHLLFISIFLSLGMILGWYFHQNTNQNLPFLDGLITAFAIGTTFLIVSKHRENWLYWFVINAASIYLYASQNLIWLTITAVILMLISLRGYLTWRVQ